MICIANIIETILALNIFIYAFVGFMYIPGELMVFLIVTAAVISTCWFSFYKTLQGGAGVWLIIFFLLGVLNSILAIYFLINGSEFDFLLLVLLGISFLPGILYLAGAVSIAKGARER